VTDEFEVALTLTGEEKRFVKEADEKPLFPWRVLSLEVPLSPLISAELLTKTKVFIAAESDGEDEGASSAIPPGRIPDLQELLQRRMSIATHPLVELYTIMRTCPSPQKLFPLAY